MKRRDFALYSAGLAATVVAGVLLSGCGGSTNTDVGGFQANTSTTVYAMTNAAGTNQIVTFGATNTGLLSRTAAYDTGGQGNGPNVVSPATPNNGADPLASQNSLAMSRDRRFLFNVNTGSATVTSFRINADGSLVRVSVVPSGGQQPNALYPNPNGDLLYVANVGNAANSYDSNVTGFRVGSDGTLSAIANSTRKLSTTNAQPSRVLFSNDGTRLIVNELTTNKISVFPVNTDGTLGTAAVTNSSGSAPFGSYLLTNGTYIVAEAPPPPTIGSVSSYVLGTTGTTLSPRSASVQNGQLASCWIIPTKDEQYFYTSNTANGTVSLYRVNSDSTVSLQQGVAGTQEGNDSGPVDGGVSADNRYLYILNSGKGIITVYQINSDATLSKVQSASAAELPQTGSEGLVVR